MSVLECFASLFYEGKLIGKVLVLMSIIDDIILTIISLCSNIIVDIIRTIIKRIVDVVPITKIYTYICTNTWSTTYIRTPLLT